MHLNLNRTYHVVALPVRGWSSRRRWVSTGWYGAPVPAKGAFDAFIRWAQRAIRHVHLMMQDDVTTMTSRPVSDDGTDSKLRKRTPTCKQRNFKQQAC